MATVLQELLASLEPPIDCAVLEQTPEETMRFMHEEKFIVHLVDDRAGGDIRLIALTCLDAVDETLAHEPMVAEQWEIIDHVEDEDFSHAILLHQPGSILSMMSVEPRTSLNSVRFNAWMNSFLQAISRKLRFAGEFRAAMLNLEQTAFNDGNALLPGAVQV